MIDPDLMRSISHRAYEIWESEGKPEGRARIHWLRAEAEFREKFCAGRFYPEKRLNPRLMTPAVCDGLLPPRTGARDVQLHRDN
jgi:hypothetical protein